jgi:uncharacterized protein
MLASMTYTRFRPSLVTGLLLLSLVLRLPASQPSATAQAHHSLWKVEGKTNTVFLLGSIHVLKAGDYPLPAVMEDAFTNSAVVAFEADISALENADTQVRLLSKVTLPEGETLSGQLSPEVYTALTNHLQQVGLPEFMFERFKPAMAAMTLEVLEMQQLGLKPEYGVDKHFFRRARKARKQIVALETVEFQLSLLTDFTKEEGELLMKVTLEEIDTTKKELGDMLKAWQTGDSDALEKLMNEASRQAPSIYKRLLTDRNERWLPKIEEMLSGGKNALVIVGAGHLVGKDGLVELLRKRGLKVTQE